MISCPHCGSTRSMVAGHSDMSSNPGIRRRRKCHSCNQIYYTREWVETKQNLIIIDAVDVFNRLLKGST